MQAGAYQNSTRGLLESPKPAKSKAVFCWLAVALYRRRVRLLRWQTTAGDEIFTARSDLEISQHNKEAMFNFSQHRRTEHYQLITQRTGAGEPQSQPARLR